MRGDVTDPPGPAAGHNFRDPLSSIIFLGHAEDPTDLPPASDHVCLLLQCVLEDTLRRTEIPPLDSRPP